MISALVNKNFGVLASNSSHFDASTGETTYQSVKLFNTPRLWITYMGSPLFLANIKREKLGMDLLSLIVYLETYLKNERPKVGKILKSEIENRDEARPFFCMFVMGLHRKLPTLVQFNSFLDFKPKYLYSEKGTKFATVFYGDENPEKKRALIDSTGYMEKRLVETDFSPGIGAEILTRGIYRYADLRKEHGGPVNSAAIMSSGLLVPLSGTLGA